MTLLVMCTLVTWVSPVAGLLGNRPLRVPPPTASVFLLRSSNTRASTGFSFPVPAPAPAIASALGPAPAPIPVETRTGEFVFSPPTAAPAASVIGSVAGPTEVGTAIPPFSTQHVPTVSPLATVPAVTSAPLTTVSPLEAFLSQKHRSLESEASQEAANQVQTLGASAIRSLGRGAATVKAQSEMVLGQQAKQLDILGWSDVEFESRKIGVAKEARVIFERERANALRLATAASAEGVHDMMRLAENMSAFAAKDMGRKEREAEALKEQALRAAKVGAEAANRTMVWVRELPGDEARNTTKLRKAALTTALRLQGRAEEVERAKRSITSLITRTEQELEEANVRATHASLLARQAVEQATENMNTVATIRSLAQAASENAAHSIAGAEALANVQASAASAGSRLMTTTA
eukprot:TRINITY_DN55128_c0_g1_i1.p1 TRINITY_DN55128_c0_g1~~TRINITY_DN55128_c0_g1_i1.p1  ORF type:complete len:409 (+),score=55.43 TRINITY_DN55128_c0_g1_i1:195-1421(+)